MGPHRVERDEFADGYAAIRRMQRKGDVAGLIGALQSPVEDGELAVRLIAAWALGRLRNPVAVEPLGECLRHDPKVEVRAQAASSLGRIDGDGALPVVIGALKHPSRRTRDSAALILGRMKAPGAREALLEARRGLGFWEARFIRRALRKTPRAKSR